MIDRIDSPYNESSISRMRSAASKWCTRLSPCVQSSRSGVAFDSIRLLIVELSRLAAIARAEAVRLAAEESGRRVAEEAARAAAEIERARLETECRATAEAEHERRLKLEQEREELRAQLGRYLLSDEYMLFAEAALPGIRAEILAPSQGMDSLSSSSTSPHILDALLNATRSDLTVCF
jgi:hypothetical protein